MKWNNTIQFELQSIYGPTDVRAFTNSPSFDSDESIVPAPNKPNNIASSQIGVKTTPPASSNVWNIVGPSVITLDKSIVNNFGADFERHG